ncbi:MAG: hypothetical protein L3K02_00745 [Thermoplasmata archaeon]|nr:hypothetical protein [Thermoplasmata archaeon]
MAVGVVHHASRTERRHDEPGLLLEFSMGRVERRFPVFDLASGKFPQSPQEPLRWALLDQPPASVFQDDDRGIHVGAGRVGPPPGDRSRIR